MRTRARLFTLLLILLYSFSANAQNKYSKQASFYSGGGLSTFDYNTELGDKSRRTDMHAGVSLSYYFANNWSIGTGIDFSNFSNKIQIPYIEDSYEANIDGQNILFNTTIENYNEEQSATYLSIPITLQFEARMSEEAYFYVQGGAMIGIPTRKRFKLKRTTYTTSTYNPTTHTSTDLGSFGRHNVKRNMPLKTIAYRATLETGVKWALGEVLYFYTGVYFDYGLNDLGKSNSSRLVEYTSLTLSESTQHSVINSQYSINGEDRRIRTNKLRPMALGVKIRLAFEI